MSIRVFFGNVTCALQPLLVSSSALSLASECVILLVVINNAVYCQPISVLSLHNADALCRCVRMILKIDDIIVTNVM